MINKRVMVFLKRHVKGHYCAAMVMKNRLPTNVRVPYLFKQSYKYLLRSILVVADLRAVNHRPF
jgi:hypothetical protein